MCSELSVEHEELAERRQDAGDLPQSIPLTFCITSIKSFALVIFSPTHRYFCNGCDIIYNWSLFGDSFFFPPIPLCVYKAPH